MRILYKKMPTRKRISKRKSRRGGVGSLPSVRTLKRRSPKAMMMIGSPLRRGYSVSSGRTDEFIVENIDDMTSLEQCKKQYRLLKYGYNVYEKKNESLRNEIEKLKRKC